MPAVAITFVVGVSEPSGDARNDERGEIDRHLFAKLAVAFDELLQIHAPHKLHHHEILAAHLSQVVSLNDVGVDQVGDESGFADEIVLELFDCRVFFPDQFDGDDFAEISRAELHRFVNQAHSAFRDLSGHLIVEFAEDVFDCCHGVRSARDSAAGKYADWSSARNLLNGEFDSRFPVKHRGRMVTLTARAAARVRAMHAETAEPAKRLRVFVESGGCSGFQYGMSFDELKPDDAVLESEGVAMLLDPSSLAYLSGSLIDFDDGLHGKGFEIKNPNAQSTCGCGKSFN